MDLDAYLGEIEKEILIKALAKSDGVRKGAAGLLGITFRSIRYRLSKFGIEVEEDTGDDE
jgi:two-component system response regulator PilR (NtrC family)